MEEPSSSKRRDTGGNRPLSEWKRFEESEGTVALYLSKVTHNCINRGYESGEEIFVDYKICNIKLLEESPSHTVALYVQEYFYSHALQIKAKKVEPEVLLWKPEDSIKHLDRNVKLMDENLQSDINKQKEEHLQHLVKFRHDKNEFQACNFDEMKEEFENLMLTISDTEASINSLTELAGSCNRTLGTVEETTLMLKTKDLSKKWSEETHYVNEHVLVRREKDKYEKARADRDVLGEDEALFRAPSLELWMCYFTLHLNFIMMVSITIFYL
ncbi:hypothetical protein MKX03_004864 [Papaver bracteatum]|nr:hypothetical protein MKX03_004864 [Papaver bracteatum]